MDIEKVEQWLNELYSTHIPGGWYVTDFLFSFTVCIGDHEMNYGFGDVYAEWPCALRQKSAELLGFPVGEVE